MQKTKCKVQKVVQENSNSETSILLSDSGDFYRSDNKVQKQCCYVCNISDSCLVDNGTPKCTNVQPQDVPEGGGE